MNANTAVFTLASLVPQSIREMIGRLPYTAETIYKSVEQLLREGLLVKGRRENESVVEVSDGFRPQKLRDIHIAALSYGIDPEFLLADSTQAVWKSIEGPRTVEQIHQSTGLSKKWIGKILSDLEEGGLIGYEKRKPIIVTVETAHPLNRLLGELADRRPVSVTAFQPGSAPFKEMITTPEGIEKALYDMIDTGVTVRGTGFVVKGEDGKFTILESVDEEPTPEALFLRRLTTAEGVEDICIRLLAHGKLDLRELLDMARDRGLVNEVGCYLDIINDIKRMVEPGVINEFERHISKKGTVFLKEERRYGKGGWEDKYEKRWNLDIYLDLDAIKHGVRSV